MIIMKLKIYINIYKYLDSLILWIYIEPICSQVKLLSILVLYLFWEIYYQQQ